MDKRKLLTIDVNGLGQPIGPNTRKLASYLGTIARNPQKAPLTWEDWRKMPIEYKNHMWDLGKCQKRDDVRNPSRAVLFSITHTRKDGRPVNEESGRVMSMLQEESCPEENTSPRSMKDDLLSHVLGKDKPGCIRMLGLGPTPSSVYGPMPTCAQALQMAHEDNVSPSICSSASSREVQCHNGKAMVYLKSFKKSLVNVALATIESKDPLKKVGGCDLGYEYWEVAINVALVHNEPLPRPYGQFKTIGDAIGATIAWPFTLTPIAHPRLLFIAERGRNFQKQGGRASSNVLRILHPLAIASTCKSPSVRSNQSKCSKLLCGLACDDSEWRVTTATIGDYDWQQQLMATVNNLWQWPSPPSVVGRHHQPFVAACHYRWLAAIVGCRSPPTLVAAAPHVPSKVAPASI
ncbi:hypothetical protein Taro_018163 [Colocasia esculenta]|uniref:Transposase Tnp1/En/Spm-like domain-containing protein n=1 Tax=Colocasia esculenta TaxID=4460 RepID=A0A843UQ74_COLES|nr:hypothetical protein [Colocasia esculenta]